MTPYRLTPDQRATYRRFAALALPRHTSYPIAAVWTTDYGPDQLEDDLATPARPDRPLSLYVHVPFCERLCYYCACTREIVPAARRRENDPSGPLLAGLETEAARLARLVGGRPARQVHLGGGTPTFLTPAGLRQLHETLRRHFALGADAEQAAEIDPRVTTEEHLQTLRALGFNRLSLGVQDFDPAVQKAVNRVQPFELVERCVAQARSLGFASLNFDLIYGLPFQTASSMADTLEKTLSLKPDRIAFYRLAVLPDMFRWQKAFRPDDLPGGDLPLELNLLAINKFLGAGYEFIGLDHFARPDEALAAAARAGTLQRNFQGMTTGRDLELIGLGPSAISQLDAAFAQNVKTTAGWATALAAGRLATERGMRLDAEDRLRQAVLQDLYGQGRADLAGLAGPDWCEHFADELRALDELAEEGLVTVAGGLVELTEPLGRLLVRVVAAVFDRYLPADAYRHGLPNQQASRVG
jgi:oxygen-independent coproporphyrinogen-3 oxidase